MSPVLKNEKAGIAPAFAMEMPVQRLLRPESLPSRLESLLRPELLPLDEARLLPELVREPSSRLPPFSRLLSDWLRDDPPLPRDELPDPDDLFDWFAM